MIAHGDGSAMNVSNSSIESAMNEARIEAIVGSAEVDVGRRMKLSGDDDACS